MTTHLPVLVLHVGFCDILLPSLLPGINDDLRVNYGVKFPVLAKIDVNGDDASPVYKYCP